MARSKFAVAASKSNRLTGGTFNIRTRVTPKPKHNTFWREQPPSPVIIVKVS